MGEKGVCNNILPLIAMQQPHESFQVEKDKSIIITVLVKVGIYICSYRLAAEEWMNE